MTARGSYFSTRIAVFSVLFFPAQIALADDYVISSNTITQNNGAFLSANDTITVNTGVTVDLTATPHTAALFANDQTNNITATNRGVLTTSQTGAGIELQGSNSTAFNFGRIATTGDGGHGISMSGFSPTATNSGTITTTGSVAHGIIMFRSGANVSVTGSIEVTGAGSVGVLFDSSSNTFFTSGRIVSTNGAALQFNGGEALLTLNAPAFFEGAMILPNSATGTFNLGASQSNHWVFSGNNWFAAPQVNGDVPYVLIGNTIATVDPTQFVASYQAQSQVTSGINALIDRRLLSFNLAKGTGGNVTVSSKYKSDPVIEPPVTIAPRSDVWVQGIGILSTHSGVGSLLNYDLGFAAATVGVDRAVSANTVLGFLGGVSASRYFTAAPFSISQKINGTGGFAGLYGTQAIGRGYFNFSLIGGVRQLSSRRHINNPLVAGGVDVATARYGSLFVSPSITFGRAFQAGPRLTITPSAHLSHSTAWLGGYTETGAAAAITVAPRRLNLLEGRAQMQAQQVFGKTSVTGTLGVLKRGTFGGDTVSGTLLATPFTYGTGIAADNLSGYFSIGIQRQVTKWLSGEVSLETVVGSTGAQSRNAQAQLLLKF